MQRCKERGGSAMEGNGCWICYGRYDCEQSVLRPAFRALASLVTGAPENEIEILNIWDTRAHELFGWARIGGEQMRIDERKGVNVNKF